MVVSHRAVFLGLDCSLFLLTICLHDVTSSVLLMFADDTKLHQTISLRQHCNISQHEIDQISTCMGPEHSLMSFNLDKIVISDIW